MRIALFASFRNERSYFTTLQTFGALPSRLSAALAKHKRFKSSRNTWIDHVEKNKRYPLKHSFHKTMKMIS